MSGNHTAKRAWKLQEFVAHGANVNCLALGHKSGRVLVTGGDDKKVNLWAVGKPNCIMSLCGHTTPVECVRFGHTEELVCAGSQSGALKIWDLEAARLARTLTGHKAGLTCIDFHPYGDFLASGSTDTNLKLWDIRRKGCIFTYKGHSQRVNSLKFSPDGQWIASAGEEGAVKIWDLRAGKLMTEFSAHGAAVHEVEFHPHEFLLASASADKTVNFWDLESFQLVSTSEKDAGPVRAITFHPERECLFSASQDSFKIHEWEPPRVCDSISLGWGKVRDIAIASTQLIGASFQMSNVSIFVVDLEKVYPFGNKQQQQQQQQLQVNPVNLSGNTNNDSMKFKAGQTVRRSFVKEKMGVNGEKPRSVMKEEPNSDDKSGTDPDEDPNTESSNNIINDVNGYENIFRPRRRELNRTPTFDDPFEAPSGSESEVGLVLSSARLSKQHKKPSPSPTRRINSDVALGSNGNGNNVNNAGYVTRVRLRKTSQNNSSSHSPVRPMSVYDTTTGTAGTGSLSHSPPRYQRATSVQPRAAAELDYRNGGDVSPPVLDHSRAQSLSRVPPIQQQHLTHAATTPNFATSNNSNNNARDFTPLTPVSRIQIGGSNGADKPLDRPTLVRPNRSSLHNLSGELSQQQLQQQQHNVRGSMQNLSQHLPQQHLQNFPHSPGVEFYQQQHQQIPLQMRSNRMSQPDLSHNYGSPDFYQQQHPQSQPQFQTQPQTPEKENFEVIPMNADKPCGIEMNDFLPKKFQDSLSFQQQPESRFSAYKGYQQQGEYSESEVTSLILKGHESMVSVLSTRGRNLEILHKLWQNKDAKAAVDHAVSLNDQAVLVDLLSVITLRPSIWNLDLCTALLPPIGELLKSKFELYIHTGCGAMKLILKNFASVIKSNIDSPMQTVGVDISREERHNKCMECYKDLVKIRSLILKRQTMQGKMGHTYRELSILMQYLD